MADPNQIPHLIKLLDDESIHVRNTVTKELASFGLALRNKINEIEAVINPVQKEHLEKILERHKRVQLKNNWMGWIDNLPSRKESFVLEYKRLERALSIFSEFLSGIDHNFKLCDLLDELENEYKFKYEYNDPFTLAKFLFQEKGLKGDEKKYYNTQNSNLVYVIKEKSGIPISLSAVFMLVGLRLGLKIEGCHFPGHFLIRINWDGNIVFVDCFNGGHIIREKDLLSIKDETFKRLKKVLYEKTNIELIVRSFLANLIRSYQIQEDEENSDLLIRLFNDMDLRSNQKAVSELSPEDIINVNRTKLKPGQCVYHNRYGYRGIIVDVDKSCSATDGWYYANQTQPSRNQPWYHVLVHGSDQVTYVAESNLTTDASNVTVIHPLITYFFKRSKDGMYIRNKNVWPGADF